MSSRPRVAVVGAGVIGLSTAVCLSETYGCQLDITVIADKFSPNTTSDRAGAILMPSVSVPGLASLSERVKEHNDLVTRWFVATFDRCEKLCASSDGRAVGVHLIPGYFIHQGASVDLPSWKDDVKDFRVLTREEAQKASLPIDDYNTFWSCTTYFMRGKFYLPFLLKQFQQNGGLVEKRILSNLSDLQSYDVIINCAGLSARDLVVDKSLYPTRGQIVALRNDCGLGNFYILNVNPETCAHIFPYNDVIIIGGTFEPHKYSVDVDPETTDDIVRRNTVLVPAIEGAEIVNTWACHRPFRPVIRLEVEQVDPQSHCPAVIHNYGHGGQGWSLHWGCAQDVTTLVRDVLAERGSVLHRAKL